MSIFSQLRQSARLSVSDVEELFELSVDIVAKYESGARHPSPRELQILKGLVVGRSPRIGKRTVSESVVIRPGSGGAMPKYKKQKSSAKLTSLELCAGGGGAGRR